MIPGLRRLGEGRAHGAPAAWRRPGDDRFPLAGWDLDGVEGLGAAPAAQFALAGGSQVADPV